MEGEQPKKRANLTKCPVCHNRMQCDLRVSYVAQMGCPLFKDEREVKWYVKSKEKLLSAWSKIFSK